MSINKMMLLGGLLLFSVTIFAQESTEENQKSQWEHNWYIEVGGGAQTLFSKNANMLQFEDRIAPFVSLTGGRWFSPYMGIRIQGQGYGMNGFVVSDKDNLNDPVRQHVTVLPDGNYRYYLRYMNFHVDYQVSLTNLIGGYKPDRKWDIIPALGIGYMHTFSYKGAEKKSAVSGHLSLMGKYRLPKGFDLNLEVQGVLLPDCFDGRTIGKCEENVALALGITYHFKHRNKNQQNKANMVTCQSVANEAALRQIIREELTSYIPSRNTKERDTIYIVKEVDKGIAKRTSNAPFTLASIRFDIGKDHPVDGQEMLFTNIARYMNTYPDAKIRLDGYADGKTGKPERNLHLSMRRAAQVRTILINDYGVDSKQIEAQGIGANYQPYEENDWNRIVIVTVIGE